MSDARSLPLILLESQKIAGEPAPTKAKTAIAGLLREYALFPQMAQIKAMRWRADQPGPLFFASHLRHLRHLRTALFSAW